jgi:hypothetical protein
MMKLMKLYKTIQLAVKLYSPYQYRDGWYPTFSQTCEMLFFGGVPELDWNRSWSFAKRITA